MRTTTAKLCPVTPIKQGEKEKTSVYRTIFLIPLFLVLIQNVQAGFKIPVSNSGNGWSVASNWLPSGVPQEGDTVLIPVTFNINIKNDVYGSSNPNLHIKVFGTLEFDPSGKLELGSNSTLAILAGGQIISHGSSSELVKIGGVVKYNGQLDGTMNGPAYASSATGESPLGFSTGVLAIRLYSFQARFINNAVQLSWTASSDHSGDAFYIQRSVDGISWNILQMIQPVNNTNETTNYNYTDHVALPGTNFYRILLSNADGKQNFSRTIPIVTGITHLKLSPNPAISESRITWSQANGANPVYLEVTNMLNLSVIRKMISPGDQFFILDTKNLPGGIYRVSIGDQVSFKESSTLIVTR